MKRCSVCKQDLPLTAFGTRSRAGDGLQSFCRDCNKLRSRACYERNREHHRRVVRANDLRYQAIVHEQLVRYLMDHPCVDCGETDIRVLEFDHRPDSGKTRDVSYLISGGASWRRVSEEIGKCDVRCRNCHGLITYARSGGNWRTAAHDSIIASIERFRAECELEWDAEVELVRERFHLDPLDAPPPHVARGAMST